MATITQLSQLDLAQTYSYADYLSWRFNDAVELIKGKIMPMSPAPNVRHQAISVNLTALLHPFFRHKQCRVYAAPFDVRLYDRKKSLLASQDIHTVVQPDLCVICNPDILDTQGCNGAPDWIIEILSNSTGKKDMGIKYALYEECGVGEYWLVYPDLEAIHQFVLDDNGRYRLQHMYTDGAATPHCFPDLSIALTDVFES